MSLKKFCLLFSLLTVSLLSSAESTSCSDELPDFLRHLYFGVELGNSKINYTNNFLLPPKRAIYIENQGAGTHIFLGYNFNRYLSSELAVLYLAKPIFFGTLSDNSVDKVKNNVVTLVAKLSCPLGCGFKLSLDFGPGMIARRGIFNQTTIALPSTTLLTAVLGSSLAYSLDPQTQLCGSFFYVPGKQSEHQPSAIFIGLGFSVFFGAG